MFAGLVLEELRKRKYPNARFTLTEKELGGWRLSAQRSPDAPWKTRDIPRIFDRAELARIASHALEDLVRDPADTEWQAHQDYV